MQPLKGYSVLYLLILLPILSQAEWSPIKIVNISKTSSLECKDLINDDIGNTYLLAESDSTKIGFYKIDSNNDVNFTYEFLNPIFGKAYQAKIYGNGTYFIITINNYYTERECDVYYSETFDSGHTWTEFQAIPHPSDNYKRMHSSILYINETGRTYIFYYVWTGYYNGSAAMVTRPPGSRMFGNEVIIYKANEIFGVNAEYTFEEKKKEITLHLFLIANTGTDRSLTYIYSKDNGVKWSPNKRLDGIKFINLLATAQKGANLQIIYGNNNIMAQNSNDSGLTWRRKDTKVAADTYSSYKRMYGVGYYLHENTVQGYYIFAKHGDSKFSYLKMNFTKMEFENLYNPFDGNSGTAGVCFANKQTAKYSINVAVTTFKDYSNQQAKLVIAEDVFPKK